MIIISWDQVFVQHNKCHDIFALAFYNKLGESNYHYIIITYVVSLEKNKHDHVYQIRIKLAFLKVNLKHKKTLVWNESILTSDVTVHLSLLSVWWMATTQPRTMKRFDYIGESGTIPEQCLLTVTSTHHQNHTCRSGWVGVSLTMQCIETAKSLSNVCPHQMAIDLARFTAFIDILQETSWSQGCSSHGYRQQVWRLLLFTTPTFRKYFKIYHHAWNYERSYDCNDNVHSNVIFLICIISCARHKSWWWPPKNIWCS